MPQTAPARRHRPHRLGLRAAVSAISRGIVLLALGAVVAWPEVHASLFDTGWVNPASCSGRGRISDSPQRTPLSARRDAVQRFAEEGLRSYWTVTSGGGEDFVVRWSWWPSLIRAATE